MTTPPSVRSAAGGERSVYVRSSRLAASELFELGRWPWHAVANLDAVAFAERWLGADVISSCAPVALAVSVASVVHVPRAVPSPAELSEAVEVAASLCWARSARFRVAMSGRLVPRDVYTRWVPVADGVTIDYVDETQVRQLVAAGATLVLDGVDEVSELIAAVTDGIAHARGAPCHANAYTSFSSTPAFPLHRDGHETLLVQLVGSKRWTVHEPSTSERAVGATPGAGEPPAWSGTLDPGDVLLIPAGWWHVGSTERAPSRHITFGLRRPTARDALQWLVAMQAGDMLDRAVSSFTESDRAGLADRLGATPMSLYDAYLQGMATPRLSVAALTGAGAARGADRRFVPRTRQPVNVFVGEDEAAAVVHGHVIRFPPGLAPVVDDVVATASDEPALRRKAGPHGDCVDQLLDALIAVGALRVDA